MSQEDIATQEAHQTGLTKGLNIWFQSSTNYELDLYAQINVKMVLFGAGSKINTSHYQMHI